MFSSGRTGTPRGALSVLRLRDARPADREPDADPVSGVYKSGGMTCARRKAGARGPFSSAPARSPASGQASPRGPPRPDARPGRRRARLLRLLPVLALLFGVLAAAPAAADVLVSNIGQQGGSSRDFLGVSHAQRFTTGSHPAGYYLESIELRLSVTGNLTDAERKTIGAELWSAATGGHPNQRLQILTVPSSVGSGAVAFTAPAYTVLAANTRYYLVIYTFHFSLSKLKVAITNDSDEDAGAAEGWSIANHGYYLQLQSPYQRQNSPNRPSWTTDTWKRQIRVNGAAVIPPETLTLTTDAAGGSAAEDAGTVTVTATLDQPATAAVTVTLAAGAASTATATDDYALPSAFTIARGETAATADVTIVDDDVDEGDETLVLTASVPGLATTPVTLTITDDDDAGVTVSDDALSVAAGGTATYTVVLDTKPAADVTVTPASGTTDNATVSSGVTLTPDDWNTAQQITVTGVKAGTSIVTHALTSSDAQYSSLSVDSVTVTVTAVAPAAPTRLLVSAGNARLDLSWTAPSFDGGSALTGYDVHYTSSTTVAADAAAGTNVATEWVAVTRTETDPPTASQTISSLTNDTAYRVRVRAKNAAGASGWETGSGTPQQTDTTGPAAPAFEPADGTTVADAGTNITLTFLEAVKKDDRNAGFTGHSDLSPILTLKAGGSSGADIGYAATVNGAGTVITIDPVNDLSDGAVYVAISAGYYDANGNRGTAASATFTVDTPSTDATLSGLAASSSTSAGGTYSALGLTPSTFTAETTSYTATVPHATTHVKLTPTVNEENAAAGVRKGSTGSFTSVASGTASSAIALDVGDNALTVRVTAEDGATTRDYAVTVTRQAPTVMLSAAPNPVVEGSSVTVTATLSAALSRQARIPLTITDNTAEPEDHGTLASIAIASGATSGTGTIATNHDVDEDHETFTVALGTLPSGVAAGTPSSVRIRIRDDEASYFLSVDATPPCGAAVTDTSVTATSVRVLTPAPATETAMEYRWLTDTAQGEWRNAVPISTSGRSATVTHARLDKLRRAFPGFIGFEFRLRNTPSVTARCTWRFDGGGGTTPTVRLSASPNPVAEGSAVTVTARLSRALSSQVAIPVTITDDTAESADHGTLASIAIASGAISGTGTIATAQDADTDDETFTVALGALPSGVTAGSPSWVRITIRDDARGGGDPGGEDPGEGAEPDLVPSFGGATVSAQLYTQNTRIAALVLPAATGGDAPLRYSLTPSPPSGLTLDAATRTLDGTPDRAQGSRRYTWRATDADGDTDELTFPITVAEDPRRARVQEAVKRALAAVARRAMSSALDNIGARFADIGASGLSLAGEWVQLEGDGAMAAAAAENDKLRPCAADRFGPAFGTPVCAPEAWSRSMEADELFGASAFSLHLGSSGADGASNPAAALWSVWGRGDLGTFAGRGEAGLAYDGELRTGWLGVDARAGSWVAGLALSRGEGEADYSFAEGALTGRGRLETTLTAVYPYGRWTLADGLELRGVVGAGTGEARHALDGEEADTGDLSMRMASMGVRQALPDLAGMALALRADGSVTQLETEDGPDALHGLSADSRRLRAGIEASRRFALDGGDAFEPFLEAAVRRDGGDGLEGSGVELAGGLRYHAPGVSVEARGRWLAAHSEAGAEEEGVSLTARADPGAHGHGLFVALSPRWGASTGAAQALWSEEMPHPSGSGNDGAVDAQVGYGFALPEAAVLTPFAEAGLAGGESRRLRLGTRFEATGGAFGVELSGERSENGTAGREHALRLDLQLRF